MLLRGLILATAALGLLLPTPALAQTRERIKITNIRLGFPPGPFTNDQGRKMYKAGQWAPVYMDLECVRDTEEGLVIWVETKDADGSVTEAKIETGSMLKNERRTAVEIGRAAYLKPGDSYAEVKVRVKGADSGRTIGPEVNWSATMYQRGGIDGPSFLLLGIGASLNTVRFDREADAPQNQNVNRNSLRGGWIETAHLLELGLLPDQWFGYSAADVIYLGTAADRQFWVDFAAPQHEKRRKALAEWVRRGGRLIVSVGANPDVLNEVKEIRDLLPATVAPNGKRNVGKLAFTWNVPNASKGQFESRGQKAEFAVVSPEPRADRSAWVIMSEETGDRKPLAVQGSYGLGRVTVIGFDLDRPPFSESEPKLRGPFYETLFSASGYVLPQSGSTYDRATQHSTGPKMDDHMAMLQGSLDFFEGVPVVSFGWVALFILIYIILIGPVDYLFLKKVVKRLEWTWVTFPVIVISVSAAAYFAAYALKGRDLKINKVDVVDIDLAGRRVDGQSWFTLFSPRIHDYSLGVEPAGTAADGGPAWSAGSVANAKDTLISWHGAVERYGSRSSSGLFDKRYTYQTVGDPDDPNRELYAAAIERVPIQVWTTKAFTARWSAPFDPAKPPVSAELGVSKLSEKSIQGTITSNLPIAENPTDITLIWQGMAFKLNDLPTGVEKRISFSADRSAGGEPFHNWLAEKARVNTARGNLAKYGPGFTPDNAGTTTQPIFRLWSVLFYESGETQAVQQGYSLNASMRHLDQSWRVADGRPEQAILVFRIGTNERSAEEATADPANPSKLWIDSLPTVANPPSRPSVPGTLKQETYVRVFIPVKPAKK
jgi:hypothetical protein